MLILSVYSLHRCLDDVHGFFVRSLFRISTRILVHCLQPWKKYIYLVCVDILFHVTDSYVLFDFRVYNGLSIKVHVRLTDFHGDKKM